MKIFIEREQREEDLNFNGKASKLLEKIMVNPQTVLIIRNGKLVTEDQKLENADEIKLMSVVSGG